LGRGFTGGGKGADFEGKDPKSIPQGLKPTLIDWLYTGDKSPAYRPKDEDLSLGG
jgi:hypothetical protein